MASGLNVPTRYATIGTDLQSAYRRAFAGDDTMFGSSEADRLIGYSGDDRISGKGGNDILQGATGNDTLLGSSGADRLSGGDGRDRLEGGNGNDKLYGGSGADIHVFDGNDGEDRIYDFRNGADRIEITDGARRFSQLAVTREDSDVHIAFDDTVIILNDTRLGQIGTEDFIF